MPTQYGKEKHKREIENYQKYKHLHPFGVRLPCPDTNGTARTFNCAKVLHIYL